MSKVKDFFYDKNDIIVTLIILLIAATIIYVRVSAIMDYPDTLVTAASDSKQTVATTAASAPSEAATTAAVANATVVIAAGDITADAVAQDLKDKSLIASVSDFQKTLKQYKLTSKIKAGTYEIPAGATDKQIIEIITQETIND